MPTYPDYATARNAWETSARRVKVLQNAIVAAQNAISARQTDIQSALSEITIQQATMDDARQQMEKMV